MPSPRWPAVFPGSRYRYLAVLASSNGHGPKEASERRSYSSIEAEREAERAESKVDIFSGKHCRRRVRGQEGGEMEEPWNLGRQGRGKGKGLDITSTSLFPVFRSFFLALAGAFIRESGVLSGRLVRKSRKVIARRGARLACCPPLPAALRRCPSTMRLKLAPVLNTRNSSYRPPINQGKWRTRRRKIQPGKQWREVLTDRILDERKKNDSREGGRVNERK